MDLRRGKGIEGKGVFILKDPEPKLGKEGQRTWRRLRVKNRRVNGLEDLMCQRVVGMQTHSNRWKRLKARATASTA